jgi:hypothetical protein
MEDDDDEEMADYGTDLSDDVESIVDPNFDAKARPQQGSTVEIRSRRSFAGASREVPFKLKLRQMTAACSLSRTLNRSRMLPVRA